MDWATLLYIWTVTLGQAEAAFWRATPRKLLAIWKVHLRANGVEEKVVGIDQVW